MLVSFPPTARADAGDWRAAFDTLLYVDDDHVTVVSPQATVAADLDDDGGEVHARAVIDVVSAASVDVISHATNGFQETRVGAELAASHRVGEWLPELRLVTSSEPDYLSLGAGASVVRRLGGPDTVLRVGWDSLHDDVGQTGTSFDVWSRTLWTHALDLSLAQNLDDRTVVRGTYTLTVQDGYQAKPYRYVPLFDESGNRLSERPPEAVPELRVRHALALRALRWFPQLSLSVRADYRYYVDSWALQAHTLELAVVVPLGTGVRMSVLNRAHYQTSASFWQREYVLGMDGELPRYRSLDRDLSREFVDTASLRVDWQRGAWRTYLDVGGQYSRFFDFLLLDTRSALLLQLGLRYSP